MDIATLNKSLEIVQECYHKVSSAQADWQTYRRTAGEQGVPTPTLPQFTALLTELTHTAEDIDRRREALSNALCGNGILQADIYAADSKRTRKIVVARPTAKVAEPSISETAYRALVTMLGKSLTTSAPFAIAVTDSSGRIVARIGTICQINK